MYADVMLLRISALSLNHYFHKEEKLEQTCCQSHYHLLLGVILVQLTVALSGQPSVDTFSLGCTIQIVRAYTDQHHSRFLANYLNSLVVQRTRFMLEESTSFPSPRMIILPVQIYEYHFTECLTACTLHGNWSYGHNCILEATKVSLAIWAFHHHSVKILMMQQLLNN